MDDKVFLFVLLIPGIILGISYYLIKRTKHGKKIFILLCALGFIANIVFKIKLDSESTGEYDLGSAVAWIMFLYVELFFILFFALIYGIVSTRKNDNP